MITEDMITENPKSDLREYDYCVIPGSAEKWVSVLNEMHDLGYSLLHIIEISYSHVGIFKKTMTLIEQNHTIYYRGN